MQRGVAFKIVRKSRGYTVMTSAARNVIFFRNVRKSKTSHNLKLNGLIKNLQLVFMSR